MVSTVSLHQTHSPDTVLENELEAFARVYAMSGYHVFPLQPRSKEPIPGSRGFKDATDNLDQICDWWTRWPDANIGIACGESGLTVVDIDPPKGGWESSNQVELPDTGTVRTGTGGIHLYYQGTSRTRTGIRPGIDIRSVGGYVVAPPSLHPCGDMYQWVNPTFTEQWAQTPNWVLVDHEIQREQPQQPVSLPGDPTPYVRAAVIGELNRILDSSNGTRNDTLNRASFSLGQLVGAGLLDHKEAVTMLEQAGTRVGLTLTETVKTVRSGILSGMQQPRMVTR